MTTQPARPSRVGQSTSGAGKAAPRSTPGPASRPSLPEAPRPTSGPSNGPAVPEAPQPAGPSEASSFWNAVYQVGRKEFLQHVRTKRLLIIGLLFVATLVLITIVLPMNVFDLDDFDRRLGAENSVSLANYVLVLFLAGFLFLSGYFFLTLLPIVLTADAVCSEWSNKTIFLLLSKPVSRLAFVVGKFAGSAFTVSVTVVTLMVLDYAVLAFLFPGGTNWESAMRFLGALGILVLAVCAWTSVSLFFSSITRSNVLSMILTISSWIIVFPLLGSLDHIIALIRYGTESFLMTDADAGIGWAQYLSPSSSMQSASSILIPTGSDLDLPTFLGRAPESDIGLSVLALVVHTLLFLGLSLWIVQRRNFE